MRWLRQTFGLEARLGMVCGLLFRFANLQLRFLYRF